ncbi:MAG: aminopeptidase [Rickettsiales bacterium]
MNKIDTPPPKWVNDRLRTLAEQPSLLQESARQLQQLWKQPAEDVAEWAKRMLATERLLKIQAAHRQNDAALIAQLDTCTPKDWFDLPELPCDVRKQKALANQMLEALGLQTSKPGAVLRINPGMLARYSTEAVLQHCIKHEIPFDVEFIDEGFDTKLVNALQPDELDGFIDLRKERIAACNHNLRIASEMDPSVSAQRDGAKFKRYDHESTEDFYKRLGRGELEWNLTYIPTEHEAKLDGFDYPAYLDFFFEACDQPWKAIHTAQAHLVQPFNNAKELHITNSDGTDIRMSLAGHTFANSVVAHNIPGSEIFSGPVKESLEGTIVAKGNFAIDILGKTRQMRDVTLRFEHGRIVEGHAVEGDDDLQAVLSLEDALEPSDPKFEGSRHIGEIGIGTNPHIRTHSVNGLLVEKIGGSFHVALGRCYGNEYLGEEVLMANGNKSDIHWDLTTMLRGKEGRMYLDGHLVQKDGEWIDCPALGLNAKDVDVLNRGWAAVPEHQRPQAWREKLTQASVAR